MRERTGYRVEFSGTIEGKDGSLTMFVNGLGVTIEGETEEELFAELDGITGLLQTYASEHGPDVFQRILDRRGIKHIVLPKDAPEPPRPFTRSGKVLV